MNGFIEIGCTHRDVYDIRQHRNKNWEVIYYTKGNGINIVGNIQYPFTEGVIMCLPPNTLHKEFSMSGFRNYHLLVSNMDDFGVDIPVFIDGENRECEKIFSQLFHIYEKNEKRFDGVIEALLALLTQYLMVYSEGSKLYQQKNSMLDDCIRFIEKNFANPNITLSEFYNKLPISPEHFIRLFKKETGNTPHNYLIEKRLERARHLLFEKPNSDYLVKDIALMCGFNDCNYFCKLFKKRTGYTPESMFS